MAAYEERPWAPIDTQGVPRSQRRYGRYRAYVPDRLVGRPFVLLGSAAADVADAEQAIRRLDQLSTSLTNTEALARLLLRAESVASSRIEGLTIDVRRLLRADWAARNGVDQADVTAREVLNNVDAMNYAIASVGEGNAITVPILIETHRLLLENTPQRRHAGIIRDRQNWIGGNAYSPMGADFVPPSADRVRPLLEDLCAFCTSDTLPAVAQAAMAHAQFETIHPFADGNGRIGRALIHLVLRRRGVTRNVTPPLSLVLATHADDYVAGLSATRYEGPPDADAAILGTNRWMETFAVAAIRAVADATAFEDRIRTLQAAWRERLAPVRANSATALLIEALPGAPVTSLAALTTLIDRALPRVSHAVERFVAAGILRPVNVGRQRGQVYEAHEVIHEFTALERGLASVSGDTKISPPTRPVPKRADATDRRSRTRARG